LLQACGFSADHKPEYYDYTTPNDETTVWTDLLVHVYYSASRPMNDTNDVLFFNDGEYLHARQIEITRVHTEVYNDLLELDRALYDGLIQTIARQGRLYRLAIAVLSSIAFVIGGMLWKKSH